ncbi:capsular polysaccharide synthesis protein [Acinetobacter ursingii]|uniref:glycosyltransferase family 32 protein n=1 Tax=Acinetobacter ursingii TaxID=108980 RepID=UPI00124DDD5F|nr:capsular polysaccharide synthesis protein [Acinetobacter ursingii]MCU4413389.1 capsular polysaccharide synthesis protein [Acinetobacter sp. WU_MDCI_Axc73]MDG9949233.1 capsular polysaccharide synthesis protein [Acinetobacter ursingii]UYF78949.1 capsular polysaccharide synthesis protein [Acinetobacter ursingii]
MIAEIKKKLKFLRYYFFRRNDLKIVSYVQNEVDVIDIKGGNQLKFVPKTIWMYWDNGELTSYLKNIVDRIKELNPDYDLIIVNKNTLKDFLPNLVFEVVDLPLANKADIIRLELLYKYGGIWIDTSTIFYSDLSWLNNAIDRNQITGYDCIGFYRDISTIDKDNPIIESWFLCVPKSNRFIKEWLDELSPLKYLGVDEYFKVISTRKDYEIIKQKITTPSYLLVYLAEQIAMRKGKFNFYLRKCENDAFFYQEQFNWSAEKMTTFLTQIPQPIDISPIIKLTNYDRVFLADLIKWDKVHKDSIIAQFLGDYN